MTKPTDADNLRQTAVGLLHREQRWHSTPGSIWGQPSGLASIDELLGGLPESGLIILGGRPSHGKTALAMVIATSLALHYRQLWDGVGDTAKDAVLFISPEMTPEDIVERFATQTSRVATEDIKRGRAGEAERTRWRQAAEAIDILAPVLKVYAGDAISFAEVQEIVDEAVLVDGRRVRLVVIDYLQQLSLSAMGGQGGEYHALTVMANGLKAMANKYRIPFLVASQLNRRVEHDNQGGSERPPSAVDLSGSGAIEAAADQAWLLWNPPEPTKAHVQGEPSRSAKLIVAKNRHGPVGEVELRYFPRLVLFADPEKSNVKRDGGL